VEGPFLIKLGSFKNGRFSSGFENVHRKKFEKLFDKLLSSIARQRNFKKRTHLRN
jgi:hypothetical protein